MQCPECVKDSYPSQVRAEGVIGAIPGLVTPIDWYYDEDGRRHVHDPNKQIEGYSCSRDHSLRRIVGTKCWCGWGFGHAPLEKREI